MGLGLSCFPALYRTVRDEIQRRGTLSFDGSMVGGYAFFLAGIAIVLLPGGGSAAVALAFLTTAVLASLGYVIWLRCKNPYKNVRMFAGDRGSRESTLFAASVLALTLCVRLFRQTASMWAVALLPIALVRSKFYGIGSIVEQAQMATAILVCSMVIRGDASAAMAGYAVRDISTLNLPVYRWALVICVTLNALAGIFAVHHRAPRHGPT